MTTIKTLARLSWHPELLPAVWRIYEAGQQDGTFTRHRAAPTGDEQVKWIGAAADPNAFALFYECGPRRLWLDLLWVNPLCRQRGLAGALIADIRTFAEAAGFERLELGTTKHDSFVGRLYQRRGFEVASVNMVLPIGPDAAAAGLA